MRIKTGAMLVSIILWVGVAGTIQANPLDDFIRENRNHVIDDVTSQIVAQLPDDVHLRLLAIGPVLGKDGAAFVDKLTEKVKGRTQFALIERHDLNKLLEEQGIQLNPLSDDRSTAEPGKIKGVEGLIMTKIVVDSANPLFATMDVFVKMDNVETGDIVFAKNFKSRHYSMKTVQIIGVAVLFLLVIIFIFIVKKNNKTRTEKFVEKDDADVISVASALKKAINSIELAHDRLVADKQMDQALMLQKQKQEIKHLILVIEQDPGKRPDDMRYNQKKTVRTQTHSMLGLCRNVLAEAEEIFKAASQKNYARIESLADRLQTETKNCMNRFQDR